MNAIQVNDYTKAWATLSAALPRPRAILAVSAHWYVPGGRVTDNGDRAKPGRNERRLRSVNQADPGP